MASRGLSWAVVWSAALFTAGCSMIGTEQSGSPRPPVAAPAVDTSTGEGGSATPEPAAGAHESDDAVEDRPTAEPSWPDTLDTVSSGVALVTTADCDGVPSGSGTAFSVGDGLFVTAAHVVDGRPAIELSIDRAERSVAGQALGVVQAEIVGIDPMQDLALLRTDSVLDGYTFSFVDELPRAGEELAALGFPLGADSLIVNQGVVSGFDQVEDDTTGAQWPVIRTDAAINPGNSGGPVILVDGSVAGVVVRKATWVPVGESEVIPAEGTGFAVSGTHVGDVVAGWQAAPEAVQVECEPVDAHVLEAFVLSDHPRAQEVADRLAEYGDGVNAGLWQETWEMYTAEHQDRIGTFDYWVSQMYTSWWTELDVVDVWEEGDAVLVDAHVRSEQAASLGPDGQTCSDWRIRYRLVPGDGDLLIDGATLTPGFEENPRAC